MENSRFVEIAERGQVIFTHEYVWVSQRRKLLLFRIKLIFKILKIKLYTFQCI